MAAGGAEPGSVMDQMLKLFEPPGGYPPERDAELHPYFRRPGRGHNHDTCDSCREGGALICCDSCPASFHLHCHDPPLEDEDIPEGDWMCIKCFAGHPDQQKLTTPGLTVDTAVSKKAEKGELELSKKPALDKSKGKAEADKSKGKPDADKSKIKIEAEKDKLKTEPQVGDHDWRPKKRKPLDGEDMRPKRATRMLKKTKYNDNSTEEEYSESEFLDLVTNSTNPPLRRHNYFDIYAEHLARKPRTTSTLFKALVEAANIQNAEEFQLPKNIHVPEKFPYAWKWSTEERRLRLHAAEDGENRGKPKLCYTCVRSSRLGPLVQCDFCPCVFHMDCLDPPLAEIPSDVWMCPNHVESLLDSRLTSSRLTERVNLWDKFANQQLDGHAVKLQFLKKCARKNPMFTRRVATVAARKRVQVPTFIKVQYAQPPSLLPGPGYERWKDPTVNRRLQPNLEDSEDLSLSPAEDDQPKIKTESSLDCDESFSPESDQTVEDTPTTCKASKVELETNDSPESELGIEIKEGVSNEHTSLENPSMTKQTNLPVELGKSAIVQKPSAPIKPSKPSLESQISERIDILETRSEDELEWVSSLVSLQTALLKKKMGRGESLRCQERFPSRDGFEDKDEKSPNSSTISGMSGKVAGESQLMEQLQDYLTSTPEVDNLDPVVLKYLASKQIQNILPSRVSQLESRVRARASLTPVGSRKLPFYLQYRSLDIGTGFGIQLNLRDFGSCSQVSDRHATLFYDELSGQYELVNYSRHGTWVDECLYSLDVGCVEKRYKKKPKLVASVPVMAGVSALQTPCYCNGIPEQGLDEFEGSAILHHGSRLKFGCLEFVFTVAAS